MIINMLVIVNDQYCPLGLSSVRIIRDTLHFSPERQPNVEEPGLRRRLAQVNIYASRSRRDPPPAALAG